MKILIAAMLPGLTGLLFAQLRAEAPTAAASPATAKVFTSPAGEFQIAFDPVLVQCARRTAAADDGSAWTPLPSCLNTVCEDADSPGASTLVCIAYPGERFSKKPPLARPHSSSPSYRARRPRHRVRLPIPAGTSRAAPV